MKARWIINIWEDIYETSRLASKTLVSDDFSEVLEEADRLLQFYKNQTDIFKASHFTLE